MLKGVKLSLEVVILIFDNKPSLSNSTICLVSSTDYAFPSVKHRKTSEFCYLFEAIIKLVV